MHEECKDNSFHLCNRSVNDEANTKVAKYFSGQLFS